MARYCAGGACSIAKVNTDLGLMEWKHMASLFKSTDSWRMWRNAQHLAAEFLRSAAIYSGILVLVAGMMVMVMPDMRARLYEAHEAALSVFESMAGRDTYGVAGRGSNEDSLSGDAVGDLDMMRALQDDGRIGNAAGTEVSAEQLDALRSYIARKYKVAYDATGMMVAGAFEAARRFDIDPVLVLAVMAIESRYNPFAESHVGAQGLMQVMTRVHHDKFDALGEGGHALNPLANIHVGTRILRDCIQRRGSVDGGLACYVGATGPGDGGYGAKVRAERRRLSLAAGLPLRRD